MSEPSAAVPQNEEGARSERDQEEAVRRELEGYYRAGKPPWDTEVTPPELAAMVEGDGALAPGRALELGCGTGTNATYLARHGWEVVAVDLIHRAVDQARKKADASGTAVRLLCADATRLDEVDAPGPFDLFFDLSCYCGIPVMFSAVLQEGRWPPGPAWLCPPVERMTWGVVSPGPEGAVGDADERSGRHPVRRNAGQLADGRSA